MQIVQRWILFTERIRHPRIMGFRKRISWVEVWTLLAISLMTNILLCAQAWAGAQQYEPLANSVRTALAATLSDTRPPAPKFPSAKAKVDWLTDMSLKLPKRIPELHYRRDFLLTLYYEAQRAGLEPELILGLVEVESGFRRYAISSAGARGYMQVMPFWTKLLSDGNASTLFNMRINLRYGCLILRHYLDIENGDMFRALGRYNGSLGKPEYPNMVFAAWKRWQKNNRAYQERSQIK